MPAPVMDRIFSAITDYSKTMGSLHGDFMKIVKRDIERFEEMTNNIAGQMKWQAGTVFVISACGAGLAVAGAIIPKGADAATTANPRLGANDGIIDAISAKLKDNEFLRSTCTTFAKFFEGIAPIPNAWFQSQIIPLQAKSDLMQICFKEGQQEKSIFDQEIRRAQDSALSILQAKAKSG